MYKNREPQHSQGIVKLPLFFLIVGIISTTIFLSITIIIAFQADSDIVSVIGFAGFSILALTLIIAQINCVIKYDDTGFTRKSFFGIKRRFQYSEITEISDSKKNITLYIGKRRVYIDELANGKSEFISLVKKKYRKLHNGIALPKRSLTHKDLFHGHVDNPGEFIFIYILLFVITIGVMIFCFISGKPKQYSDLNNETVAFNRYEISKNDLILYTNNKSDRYIITDYKNYTENIDNMLNKCDGNSVFQAWDIKIEKSDDQHYDIWCLKDSNEEIYLSLDNTNAKCRKSMWQVISIFGVMLCIFIILAIFSIKIGRNPQKYSKKVIRFFFRDGYVH